MGHTGNPIIDGLVVLCRVLDAIMNLLSIILLTGLVPSTHMYAYSEAVRKNAFSSLDINIVADGRGVRMEVRMMGCQFTTER